MTEEIEIPPSFPRGSDVTGKRVVITGAGRGLGRLLAHAFSMSGASVVLVSRTEADLKAVADELPGESLVCSGDVTDADFNESVADAARQACAGVVRFTARDDLAAVAEALGDGAGTHGTAPLGSTNRSARGLPLSRLGGVCVRHRHRAHR